MNRAGRFLLGFWVALSLAPLGFAQEAGSNERVNPLAPLPIDMGPEESGSGERPGGVIRPGTLPPEIGHEQPQVIPRPMEPTDSGKHPPASKEPTGSIAEPFQISPLIVPMVVFLVGLWIVGWLFFRMGLFNPYTATLWPKRLELCIELALRMDDFMTAYGEENFTKCQMSLDALNHLNGRRSILLSNEINAAVNKFTELAVNAKVSKADEAFQKDLNRQYEIVIEALRIGTRQEELSLEVLRSLTKAQGPHRRLKE